MQDEQRPRVGVGVIVVKNGLVLIGKRKGSHGEGQWAWPGGHLEYMESFLDCAKREG
jgi:8-oxo-dGTP diphosphatase